MAEPRVFRRDHYAEVTARIIAALESSTPPWRRPWDPARTGGGGPVNGVSGHRYRGINTLLLGMAPQALATGDPRWLSFRQSQERGWRVRKGERASTAYFFKRVELWGTRDTGSTEETAPDGEGTRTVPVLRSYPVFHASQVDGVPAYVPPTAAEAPWRTPETASVILVRSGARLEEGGDRAFYSPAADLIRMPPRAAFAEVGPWAATLLHELGHWTGHPSRLDRDLSGRFSSAAYAMEELRAEIASAFIGAELGLPTDIPQSASYVDSWLEVLRRDQREVFRAAADAQRIADYVLGFHPLYAARMAAAADAKQEDQPSAASIPRPALVAGEMPEHVRRTLGRERGPAAPAGPVALTEDTTCAPSYRR
jgi:antirestriction protein ArdC